MDPKRQQPQATPPVKVVGFHVEGASPSPRPSTLADAHMKDVSTSPSPVIIPPLFQNQRDGPSSPIRAPSAPPGALPGLEEGEASGLPSIRTSATAPEEAVAPVTRTPVRSPASKDVTPRPLPVTPVMSAPPGMQTSFEAAAGAGVLSPRGAGQQPAASGASSGSSATLGAASPPGPAAAAAAAALSPPKARGTPKAAAKQQQQQHGQQQQPAGGAAGHKPGKAQRHVEPPPKKELSRAERRALQEAQRAAKAAAKAEKDGAPAAAPNLQKQGSGSNLAKQAVPAAGKAAAGGVATRQAAAAGGEAQGGRTPGKPRGAGAGAGAAAGAGGRDEEAHATKSTELFAHLPSYRKISLESLLEKGGAAAVPLEAVKLGLQIADGSIRGGNARCAAMLTMFMRVIKDFKAPAGKEVAKELLGVVNAIVAFLVSCRPLSVTMGNAIKHIKCELERLKLQPELSEQQVKEELEERISSYLQEKIRAADNLIIAHAIAKIQDGDVILTYSHSTLVAAVLLKAHEEGRRFSVVVADARPHLEGRRLLRALLSGGISCEYVYLNALSFSLDRVTKVMLGAGAVLSNGTVISRVGSAAVAMMAAAERIPVLVCCETYKFHERVQLDSITQNELGDPDEVSKLPDWARGSPLEGWREVAGLGLLNLKYDAMPADFVSVVVTEAGLIPPTSVAVILRETRQDVMV